MWLCAEYTLSSRMRPGVRSGSCRERSVCARVIKSKQHYLAWRRNYVVGHAWQAESMDELAPDWEGRQGCLEQSRPPTDCCVLLETDKGRGASMRRERSALSKERSSFSGLKVLCGKTTGPHLSSLLWPSGGQCAVTALCACPGFAPESLLGTAERGVATGGGCQGRSNPKHTGRGPSYRRISKQSLAG